MISVVPVWKSDLVEMTVWFRQTVADLAHFMVDQAKLNLPTLFIDEKRGPSSGSASPVKLDADLV